jgi:predicted enzyme related to lactoylglutathione lyase
MIRYKHTNLIAKDWKKLSVFYQSVFKCKPVPPERDLSGKWLDRITHIQASHITGIHLRLPGFGDNGPTLEIFQYDSMPEHPNVRPNTPGFSHIAFEVEDVKAVAEAVFAYGGTRIGDLVIREIPDVGQVTVQYVADPEGNIIEIQKTEPMKRELERP